MIKNKSTLAKLLAEEDIFVVHKQMETAYFNSKSRELGLPIWKDEEMTKDIYDLMVCHEIGHALWTPLDMLENAAVRKLDHSFVNILEDLGPQGAPSDSIQVAAVGSVNIGGLNEAHYVLFPDVATNDRKILEEKFVEYLNDEVSRFRVMEYAWETLNEVYSYDVVKRQLLDILERPNA